MSDLNKELEKARSTSTRSGPGGNPSSILRDLLFSIPGGTGGEMSREMEGIERIRAGPAQGGKRPEDMTPQEVHAVLWQVLSWRDSGAWLISCVSNRLPTRATCSSSDEEDFKNDWYVVLLRVATVLTP